MLYYTLTKGHGIPVLIDSLYFLCIYYYALLEYTIYALINGIQRQKPIRGSAADFFSDFIIVAF